MTIENISTNIGKRLSLRRKVCNLTQRELAHKCGVTLRQQQKYESGVNKIESSRLFLIASILKVNISYFFEDSEVEEHQVTHLDNKDIRKLISLYIELSPAAQKNLLDLLNNMVKHKKIPKVEEV